MDKTVREKSWFQEQKTNTARAKVSGACQQRRGKLNNGIFTAQNCGRRELVEIGWNDRGLRLVTDEQPTIARCPELLKTIISCRYSKTASLTRAFIILFSARQAALIDVFALFARYSNFWQSNVINTDWQLNQTKAVDSGFVLEFVMAKNQFVNFWQRFVSLLSLDFVTRVVKQGFPNMLFVGLVWFASVSQFQAKLHWCGKFKDHLKIKRMVEIRVNFHTDVIYSKVAMAQKLIFTLMWSEPNFPWNCYS